MTSASPPDGSDPQGFVPRPGPLDGPDPQGFVARPGPLDGPDPQSSATPRSSATRTGPGVADDEAQWQRPAGGAPSLPPPVPSPPREPVAYAGPPANTPPPAGWRPPLIVQTPPPRALPPQDLPGLDEAEQRARTLTYGIAMVAAAIMILVMFVLCGQALF